jgi:hypothetical protein
MHTMHYLAALVPGAEANEAVVVTDSSPAIIMQVIAVLIRAGWF